MSPEESRLVAAERRTFRIGEEIRDLRRQLAAIGQGIWDLGAEPEPGFGVYNATVAGTITSCSGGALPDGGTVTVTILGGSFGPVATSGGAYSLPVYVTGTAPAAITWTPPGSGALARYQATTFTGSAVAGSSVPQSTFAAVPAAGYHCWSGCAYPIPDTLYLDAPEIGVSAAPVPWTGVPFASSWGATASANYPGGGTFSCPAVNPLTITIDFNNLGLSVSFPTLAPAPCPNTAATGTGFFAFQAAPTTLNCFPFSFAKNAGGGFVAGGINFALYE